MRNPYEQEVENRRVRGCCPKCHTPFHERVHRVVSFERVVCLSCRNERRIHGIGHIHEHESVQAYIHHVEERTSRPHLSLRD